MAGDIFQFVDKVSSAANLRLDINDQSIFAVKAWDAPPPPLRRIVLNNTLSDGGAVSSSSYDNRTLTITLELVTTDQDTNATNLQKLARELDRTTNFLKYKPVGATSAVYFKTYRSSPSDIQDLVGAAAIRTLTLDILAEPFAIGERLDILSLVTVSSNPASVSNPCYVTTPTILGDVPVRPIIVWNKATVTYGTSYTLCVASEPDGNTGQLLQAESGSMMIADTTVSATNDATFSGAGVGNYATCTFATSAGNSLRVAWANSGFRPGRYRVLVRAKQTVAADVTGVSIQWNSNPPQINGSLVKLGSNTNFQLVDAMGVYQMPMMDLDTFPMSSIGPGGMGGSFTGGQLNLWAYRSSGTGSLQFDYVQLIPADYSCAFISGKSPDSAGSSRPVVFDGEQNVVYSMNGTDTWGTTGTPATILDTQHTIAGGLPTLTPGQAWRIWFFQVGTNIPLTNNEYISVSYFPRYLYVRPAST